MNSQIALALKTPPKNLVVVTGVARSGKTMLAPIIASLEKSENPRTDYLLEQFPMLNMIGLISADVASYLMRFSLNLMIYDNLIGRNTNFRFSDLTSIWNTADPGIYFKRLLDEEGDAVFERMDKMENMSVFLFHNAVWHAKIFLKTFPDIKMIHLMRHPIDVIYSWYRKGYGADFYEKPRTSLLTLQWKNKVIPYYAFGWEEEYDTLSEMDRIIRMINIIQEKRQETFSSLSPQERSRIMTVSFEEMVTIPDPLLGKICEFLNTKETLHTSIVLKKQRCPRILSVEDRKMKYDKIAQLATPRYSALMEAMINDY